MDEVARFAIGVLKTGYDAVRQNACGNTHSFISPSWQPNTENTENKQ